MQVIPEVTKNLLILNILMYLAQATIPWINQNLPLYPVLSDQFQPFQFVTHMFMHGNTMHIFFNMFALFMFGPDIERAFGPKKFLLYYLLTGLGAASLHLFVSYMEAQYIGLPPEVVNEILNNGRGILVEGANYTDAGMAKFNLLVNIPVLGASGAVYGILAAFGMLYPNRMLLLIIPPIPVKAKYLVLFLGVMALYLGVSGKQPGVAHFAHLGGAIFGVLMILYWRSRGERF